ncbi:MAG: hypothetical protein J3K34DRAFT_416077 [Monoraphidium minutum]|nr:MAG: hypothetical protein J3K34DRAFT_416077 [Monoraphidium minutum]
MAFLFSPQKSVADLIRADHNKARELYEQYQMPYTTADQKQILAYSIIREVSMHSAAEEVIVYPAMRQHMGDCAPDHLLKEHQTLKEELSWLSSHKIHDTNYDARMQTMMEDLVAHMREEEDDLLPRFAATEGVTAETMTNLARWFEAVKRVAPTRPHPVAPNKPAAANLVTCAMAAPLDYALDMIRFRLAPPL